MDRSPGVQSRRDKVPTNPNDGKKVGNPSLRLLRKPTMKKSIIRRKRPRKVLPIVSTMVYMDMTLENARWSWLKLEKCKLPMKLTRKNITLKSKTSKKRKGMESSIH
jgi:hypothetical protein